MKDTTEILHLMEEGTKCQDHDMNRAKEAFRRAQVSFICRMTYAAYDMHITITYHILHMQHITHI